MRPIVSIDLPDPLVQCSLDTLDLPLSKSVLKCVLVRGCLFTHSQESTVLAILSELFLNQLGLPRGVLSLDYLRE